MLSGVIFFVFSVIPLFILSGVILFLIWVITFFWFKFCCIVLNIFETERDIGFTIGGAEFGIVILLNAEAKPLEFGLNGLKIPFLFGLYALSILFKNP